MTEDHKIADYVLRFYEPDCDCDQNVIERDFDYLDTATTSSGEELI